MDRNGMYENTPWERIAEYGLWVGLGVLVLAIAHYLFHKRASAPHVAENFAPSGISAAIAVAVMGFVFTQWWVEAHANYPYPFGRIMLGTGIGVSVVGLIAGFAKRSYLPAAWRLAALLIPVTTAIYISATSKSIIAEGQVTAMVLPYVWIIALMVVCALAPVIEAITSRIAPIRNSAPLWAGTLLLLALIYFINDHLPVVQFRDDDSVFPVMAPTYIVLMSGLFTAFLVRSSHAFAQALPWIMGLAASGYAGYQLGYTYGIAIAATGAGIMWTVSTAFRRQTLY